VAQCKRGLCRGLKTLTRSVILFADSTIVREIPPLYSAWAPINHRALVPIVGSHNKRVLTGALNVQTGAWYPLVTTDFQQEDFHAFLRGMRKKWRGWHIVLFIDKHSVHRSPSSRNLARQLGIKIRWLPTATPQLNAMDTLWRHAKEESIANEPNPKIDDSVDRLVYHIDSLSAEDRLRKAGVLSENYWLRNALPC
jgi:hypothetical protein